MRLRQLPPVTHGNSSRMREVLVSVVLYSVMVYCTTHAMEMKLIWSSLRMLGYGQTYFGSSMMTLVVGILICIKCLVPYPNDIGGKDCMLLLNNTVNNGWFARERRL